MAFRLMLVAMVSIGASILCTYCYRHKLINDHLFLFIMMIIGAVCVCGGMVVLGVPYNAVLLMLLFATFGALLGFQGARVIVRSTKNERRNV